jgi:hypothetical protein
MCRVEVVAHVCGNLPIRRVIRGFDANHPCLERGIVPVEEPQQQELRCGRAEKQDFVSAFEGIADRTEKSVLVIRVVVRPGELVLWMPLDVVCRRLNGRSVELLRANVEEPRLLPIDPHRHVMTHEYSLMPNWAIGPGRAHVSQKALSIPERPAQAKGGA